MTKHREKGNWRPVVVLACIAVIVVPFTAGAVFGISEREQRPAFKILATFPPAPSLVPIPTPDPAPTQTPELELFP